MMNVAISGYEAAKDWLVPSSQDERSLLHIHLGMGIFMAGVVFSKRWLRSGRAVLLLLTLELLNETADIASAWPDIRRWRIIDTASDIFNTMLWPSILWAAANIRHGETARDPEDQVAEDPTGDAEAGAAGLSESSEDGGAGLTGCS